jgi:glycosyltransferase involved in cell wall biosynthesis
VTDFVSAKTIYNLKELTGAKIVYIMTDNSPIGGGCHYPWDCQGYTKNCYPCPALGMGNHRAQKTLNFKHRYITDDMIISGTTNDTNRAKKSLLFRNSEIVVSAVLGKNPYVFERSVGRKLWNIDDERFVIFCGAASINAERKGFKQLLMAMEYLKILEHDISNILILVAGDTSVPFPDGYEVKYLGRLGFEDLFKAYCCADMFVCPSLEDSGPMMINYGVMAYIPVVSFEMGIAPDIILHKKNGYMAKWNDHEDFARGIYYWMHNKYNKETLKEMNNELMNQTMKEKSLWKYLDNIK